MQALAHYALLGSLLAGVAGAAILALVTIQHSLKSRRASAGGDEESAEQSVRRMRAARVADTLAVLCFAIAASLGVFGLTQARAVSGGPDGAIAERVQQLETRLSGAESELRTRSAPTGDLKAWEERLARLESRLGAIEERASVADRRLGAAEERVAATDRRVGAAEERAAAADRRAQAAERVAREEHARDTLMMSPSLAPISPAPPVPTPAAVKPAPMAAPPGSAPIAPERSDASLKPEASSPSAPPASPRAAVAPPPRVDAPKRETPKHDTAKHEASGSATTAQATSAPRREPARVQRAPVPTPTEPTLGEKLRQDWESIKRDTARGGDEWRDGWQRLRRLFTP